MTRIIKSDKIKSKTIAQAIGTGTTTISHDLGKVARNVTFKISGQEESFVWNDKSGSLTQIDIESLTAYGSVEINIIAY
jgi:hypothetical protein